MADAKLIDVSEQQQAHPSVIIGAWTDPRLDRLCELCQSATRTNGGTRQQSPSGHVGISQHWVSSVGLATTHLPDGVEAAAVLKGLLLPRHLHRAIGQERRGRIPAAEERPQRDGKEGRLSEGRSGGVSSQRGCGRRVSRLVHVPTSKRWSCIRSMSALFTV